MKGLIIYYFLLTKYREKRLHSASRLSRYHQKHFNRLKKRVLCNSPFYKPYLSKPLSAFPIINKEMLMTYFNQINTVGIDKEEALSLATQAEYTRDFTPTLNNITVGLSSGTSGKKGLFLASKRESAYWVGSMMAKLFDFPLKKQQRIALFLRSNSNLYGSLNRSNKIIFQYFDITSDFNGLMNDLKTFDPTIIAAPPSVLMQIITQLDCKPPELERVFSVAETLDQDDQGKLENWFNCPISQIYQATEGFLAITHQRFNQLMFNEDNLIIEKEWLDDKRFIPIVTDLRRCSLPIVRYRLDDVIVQKDFNHPFTSIAQIEGREGDICYAMPESANAKCQLAPIFSDILRHAVARTSVHYEDYRIEQTDLSQFHLTFTPCLTPEEQCLIEQSLTKIFKDNQYIVPTWHWYDWQTEALGSKRRKIIGLPKTSLDNLVQESI